jgi:hypothetical protein
MTSTNMKVSKEVVYFIDKIKKSNLFSGEKIKKRSISNLYLMLSGICYRLTGQKTGAIKYFLKSFIWSPGNVWNKKIKSKLGFK